MIELYVLYYRWTQPMHRGSLANALGLALRMSRRPHDAIPIFDGPFSRNIIGEVLNFKPTDIPAGLTIYAIHIQTDRR